MTRVPDHQKFSIQVHISHVSNLQGRKQFPLPPLSRTGSSNLAINYRATLQNGMQSHFFSFFFFFDFVVFLLHAANRFRVSNDKGTRARMGTIDVCAHFVRAIFVDSLWSWIVTEISKYFLPSADSKWQFRVKQ